MSKQDADRTIMVRMERITHMRVEALRTAMIGHALRFPDQANPSLLDNQVSLSDVINVLLDRYWAHRRRGREYRARRKKLRILPMGPRALVAPEDADRPGDATSPNETPA